jgi:hypothetical protein
MSTLTALLKGKQALSVITGEVVSEVADGLYKVSAGGRDVLARVAAAGDYSAGTRVVLSQTDEGTYIIGLEKVRLRQRKEVRVDG